MKAPVAAALACLLWVPGAPADWTAHADFSNCPRKYFPNLTAEEGPFATESACDARVAEARRGNNASCARYSCKENAGSSAASTEPGHALDGTIERAISAGASGDISAGDAASLAALGVIGNAILAGASSSPEQQRQAEARREQQRQEEAERARQQTAAEEARKERLLGEMQGVEQGTDLQLMTDNDDPSPQASNDAGGGELALMTDDDTRGFMARRKAPIPERNQPPATRVNVGPYNTPASGTPQARGRDANPGADGQVVAMNAAAPEPARAGPADRESMAQGAEDGNACRQRNVGMHCGVLRGEALASCQRSYNAGYDNGARDLQRRLSAQGAAAGTRDSGATPKTNRALSYAEARGSCGNAFVQAYNNAFR